MIKKQPHQIDVGDVATYEFSHRIAGSHGRGENKVLDAIVSFDGDDPVVNFEVQNHRERVLLTHSLRAAIEAYNAC